jgi:hypothetical protein
LRGEEDCGEGGYKAETADDGPAIAEALRDETVDEEANNFSDLCALAIVQLGYRADTH